RQPPLLKQRRLAAWPLHFDRQQPPVADGHNVRNPRVAAVAAAVILPRQPSLRFEVAADRFDDAAFQRRAGHSVISTPAGAPVSSNTQLLNSDEYRAKS